MHVMDYVACFTCFASTKITCVTSTKVLTMKAQVVRDVRRILSSSTRCIKDV
jgi:hypothetical protein